MIKMTPQQQSLWVLNDDDNSCYNVPLVLNFDGDLDIQKLKLSLTKVANSTAILRSKVNVIDGMPYMSSVKHINLDVNLENVSSDQEYQKEVGLFIHKPFTDNSLLFRTKLFKLSAKKYKLVLVFSHLIIDEWSLSLFADRLIQAYSGFQLDSDDLYLDYEKKLENIDLSESKSFWKNYLNDSEEFLDLPTSFERPTHQLHKGNRVYFFIPEKIFKKLQKLSRDNRITSFNIYYSIYSLLLSQYSHQKDIIIGTLFANRMDEKYTKALGYFANTLPIRNIFNNTDENFLELFKRTQKNTFSTFNHSELSLKDIVNIVKPRRDSSYNPLVQALFVYQNIDFKKYNLDKLKVSSQDINTYTSKLDINLTLFPTQNNIDGFVEYDSNLFTEKFIKQFVNCYINLLNTAANNPSESALQADLLSNDEINNYIYKQKESQTDIKVTTSLIDEFEKSVKKYPHKIAVKDSKYSLTYEELNNESNKIANLLLQSKLPSESKVAILLDRNVNVIISILGVLKAGYAYVPIDASYPQQRIDYILNDADVSLVLTSNSLKEHIFDTFNKIIVADILNSFNDISDPKTQIKPENLAYVIYTSGSTGKPKGVLVEHHNVVRLIKSTAEIYNFESTDVWTMFHSYAFDFSIWEIWGALLNGSTLIVVPFKTTRNPQQFYELVSNEKVTILSQTPSAFKEFQQIDLKENKNLSLRYVTFGGEKLNLNSLKSWYGLHDSSAIKLVNMYGITETTVHSTAKILNSSDLSNNTSNIGHALPDLAIYLVNEYGNIVPEGVIGEMLICGQGVTRGYLNRDDLTNERFIDVKDFSDKYKTYKSGDLAKINSNGELEYIRRSDNQVKVRGFRIELGEIENALNDIDSIKNSVVVTNKEDESNILVAYLTSSTKINLQEVIEKLKSKLPDYMIPSRFIQLENIPLTTNGKVNTRKLPLPNKENILSSSKSVKPNNEDEARMLAIWKEILDVDKIGITDNFFDLGGHSLLAVKLMGVVKNTFGKELPISELFNHPTIRSLTKLVKEYSQNDLDNLIVPIKNSGEKTPLFMVHPGMGQVMCFKDLAKDFDSDRPLFAIRANGLYGECNHEKSVEETAKRYIREIKKIQPSGPYNLSGYCVGGIIADEMAYQLRKNNEEVNSLILLDIEPPHGYDHLNEEFIVDFFVDQFFNSFNLVNGDQKNKIKRLSEKELKEKHFTENEYLNYMLSIAKKLNIVDDSYSIKDMGYWYNTWKQIILNMDQYRAKIIDVPIITFHAVDGDYIGNEWNKYSKISKTVDIPGDHYTMLEPPLVSQLSKKISKWIDHYDKKNN